MHVTMDEGKLAERCPRCSRALNRPFVAGSRATAERDWDICGLCGELEAERDARGLGQVSVEHWPVSPQILGEEFAFLMDRIQ